MRLIKIGMANGDPTVGALASNTDRMIANAQRMNQDECTLGCFPEQSIPGYPVVLRRAPLAEPLATLRSQRSSLRNEVWPARSD